MPVPQGPVFRHGTRAQPFQRLAPGTSVATAIGLGRNIATGGSCYADTPQDGTPRVMRLQVDLPHGARFIPADSKTRREVAHLEEDMAAVGHAAHEALPVLMAAALAPALMGAVATLPRNHRQRRRR